MIDQTLIAAKRVALEADLLEWGRGLLQPGEKLIVHVTLEVAKTPPVVVQVEETGEDTEFRRGNAVYLNRELTSEELGEVALVAARSGGWKGHLIRHLLESGNQPMGGREIEAFLVADNRARYPEARHAVPEANHLFITSNSPFRVTFSRDGDSREGPFRIYRKTRKT